MDNNNTAVFVPSYCLFKDGSRLTNMSMRTTNRGLEVYREKKAGKIIFSTAYSYWRKEADCKRKLFDGINNGDVFFLEGVTNSFDEVKLLSNHIEGIEKLFLVAEQYHAPRMEKLLRKKFPKINITRVDVNTIKFERTLEPSIIKRVRVGSKTLWVLWNWLFRLVS